MRGPTFKRSNKKEKIIIKIYKKKKSLSHNHDVKQHIFFKDHQANLITNAPQTSLNDIIRSGDNSQRAIKQHSKTHKRNDILSSSIQSYHRRVDLITTLKNN